jgi:glycosyltransferase involved in cell wall biosynthesis
MPVLSVIVPIYNVEDYLALCLSSIRKQSLRDIEIVCVNDGSFDQSAEILELCAAVDPRIRIVEKPNGGLSSARNVGIRTARGKYLMFVDSDDFIEVDACKKVVAAFEEHDAEVVTFGAHPYPEGAGDDWLRECLSPEDKVYAAFDIDILFKENSRPFVWRTAFAANFLKTNGLWFDETVHFGEDQIFHFMAYPRAKRTVLLSDKLYHYRVVRKDSLMSIRNKESLLKLKEHLAIVDCILIDWHDNGWLAQYPTEMLNWVFEFLVYDIYCQDVEGQTELLRLLRHILERRFEGIDLAAFSLPNAIRTLYRKVLETSETDSVKPLSRILAYRWYAHERGVAAGMARIAKAPFRILRSILRHILPTPTSSLQHYLSELTLNFQESHRAADALLLLTVEYQSKRDAGALYGVTKEKAAIS